VTRLTKADEVLRKIEKMAEKRFLPIIGPDKGKILVDAFRKDKPKHILEVGTLIGYSTILIGRELDETAKIFTIEINAKTARMAKRNVEQAQIPPKVEIIVGDALKIIPTLKDCFDTIFIDAEKTEYLQYLKLMEDKLHEGTVVVADNVGIFADQMKDYLAYVRNSGKYRSKYVQVGEDGVEISIKM
jgi:predicted O-methyltransferase YrrM